VGRNLVLCLDGTGYQYAAVNTNVVKLYAMLDRERSDQLAYYQPGIGTLAPPGVWDRSKRWLIKHLDLAIGWLLEEHVTCAYRYVMRYYQEGDKIFIFGFSRGAYTARAVAAMIYKVGLLTQGNEELLSFAWDTFRYGREREVYEGFRRTFSRRVGVHFLGLWDTVSSIGWAWNPQHFQFTANNPGVGIVRHAVALDERRATLVQNLWGEEPPTDVVQVWFPGVHCDIGGGYPEPESGLSKITLRWMVEHAEAAGVVFNAATRSAMLPEHDTGPYVAPSVNAPPHESLSGLWWILEYVPKRINDPAAGYARRWMVHAGRRRFVRQGSTIDASVFERQSARMDYRPSNIPEDHLVGKGTSLAR
jgi:uncharacterized protein (DUF2235 family)